MPTRFMMNKVGYVDDQRFLVGKNVVFEEVRGEEEENKDVVKNSSCFKNVSNISSSSSIGKNSDLSENSVDKSGDGEEVQSSYKGPLDAMEALEEVLPIRFLSFPLSEFLMVACSVFDFFQVLFRVSILVNDSFLLYRRGISRFYKGKSKSFASLVDASSSSSLKDIAKPENAYMRKRRNLLSHNLRGNNGGAISKRVTTSNRTTTLALAIAMKNSESDNQCDSSGLLLPLSSSPGRDFDFSPWRSFSFADLHHCVSVAMACSSSNELATKQS